MISDSIDVAHSPALRTFIYGSCVSRDMFEFLPQSGYRLIKYVARQSLLSMTSPPIAQNMPQAQTTSGFQQRMLTGDWTGSLYTDLNNLAGEIDLLLWDIFDERLGVYALAPRDTSEPFAYCTRSVDSISSGRDDGLISPQLIPFGSARHRILFNRALAQFRLTLEELNLLDRCVLVAPPWALHDNKGDPTPASFGLHPKRANRLFSDYYAIANRLVTSKFVDVPSALAVADANHHWGLAPFHYVPRTYRSLATKTDLLARLWTR